MTNTNDLILKEREGELEILDFLIAKSLQRFPEAISVRVSHDRQGIFTLKTHKSFMVSYSMGPGIDLNKPKQQK